LSIREANHFESEQLQTQVPRPIGLERRANAVIAVAVQLHDEVSFPPEEIDLVRADANVCLGPLDAVAAAKTEKPPLEGRCACDPAQRRGRGRGEQLSLPDRAT
jgi:hypothetical protein